jgi:hypothetical protein
LESALATERTAHAESRARVELLAKECDHLRASHERLRQDLELLRRRIFVAKAERVDSTQLELEFAQKLSALDALSGQLGMESKPRDAGTGASSDGGAKPSPSQPATRSGPLTSTTWILASLASLASPCSSPTTRLSASNL